MSPVATRRLLAVHRWASVIVSANFIVLALTGLILVFHNEIDVLLGVVPEASSAEAEDHGELVSVARAVDIAQAEVPALTPLFVTRREELPHVVMVGFVEGDERARASRMISVDRRTAEVLPKLDVFNSFTFFVLRLHAELLAGPPGRLILGVIGLAILVSIVSGFVVYGPMMRRFAFGLLRRDRSRRAFLADLHKLLGASTFAWNFVVAATGVFLCLAVVLFQGFARSEVQSFAKAYAGQPVVTDLSTLDEAIAGTHAAAPTRAWQTVLFPGGMLASRRHYTVFLEGGTGFEGHMLGIAVVDAVTPADVKVLKLPLYLKALLLSEPLHFGDYGGLPLKLVWTAFGLISLILSVTGLWVFISSLGRKERA
jgi:uncharacterized iron-regulated membrane protein